MGPHSHIFSFHSTAKGYDRKHSLANGITPQAYPQLLGYAPLSPLTNNRASKGLVSQMAALFGLPWANDVASRTLCPPSMHVHCREGDWDQRGRENGEPHFWPCFWMGPTYPIHHPI